MGIPRLGEATASSPCPENKKQKTLALLIWGASSSVGTMAVQSARLLRDDRASPFAAVYATAGPANHAYVGSLGADRVFDYSAPRVVDAVVDAAREDGLLVRHCFLATGRLAPCQAVLKAVVGGAHGGEAKIASAPVLPADVDVVDGVETFFVMPSMDEGERLAHFQYWLGSWPAEKLVNGAIRPSPEPRVVGKGLAAVNAGLDVLLRGVSCAKLVVEVTE